MNRLRKLLLYLCLLTLTQCSKCKKNDPTPQPPKDPLSLLPPETQSGAGTFGCLINGQAFITTSTISTRGDWQSNTKLGVSATLYKNGDAGKGGRGFLHYDGLKRPVSEQSVIQYDFFSYTFPHFYTWH